MATSTTDGTYFHRGWRVLAVERVVLDSDEDDALRLRLRLFDPKRGVDASFTLNATEVVELFGYLASELGMHVLWEQLE